MGNLSPSIFIFNELNYRHQSEPEQDGLYQKPLELQAAPQTKIIWECEFNRNM